jgi:hypothetical protein
MPITLSSLDNQFRFRPALNGGGLRTKIYPEAASSNFRYGEPVIISTSGGVDYVTQIATLPSANSASTSLGASVLVLGFALANSTGTTGSPIPVLLAQGTEVLTRVFNSGGGASAEVQDVAVGDVAELFRYRAGTGTTDVFMVISDAPNGTYPFTLVNKAIVVERYSVNNSAVNPAFLGEQAPTDTYGLVWVAIRPGAMAQVP